MEKYTPKKYSALYSDNDILKKCQQALDEAHKLDEDCSFPLTCPSIPAEIRTAERETRMRIGSVIPQEYRTVSEIPAFAHRNIFGFGRCGVINEQEVVFIDSYVAKNLPELLEPMCMKHGYFEWVKENRSQSPSSVKFFQTVLAHELGHQLEARLQLSGYPLQYNVRIPKTNRDADNNSEAFAFWFGDAINNTATPQQTIEGYTLLELDPKKIREGYDKLKKLEKKEGIAKTILRWKELLKN